MFTNQGSKQPISLGNETFDKFLGGGLLNSSLNIFERQGPNSRILEVTYNKSLAASTLSSKNNLIYVNFNTLKEIRPDEFLRELPMPRKVKSELLYKDVRGKSATATIKIAWRYSSRSSSPSDSMLRVDQVDFGASLNLLLDSIESNLKIINIRDDFTLQNFFIDLESEIAEMKKSSPVVNIIIQDLLHPFSPIVDNTPLIFKFMYALRGLSRTIERGAILVSYDTNMSNDHEEVKEDIYNIADCVVSFFSYETGQNRLSGYKNTDGTIEYIKVPKINSLGLHFQRELSDWGYRYTKNHRFFVVDELNLPPCDDDEGGELVLKKKASELTRIENKTIPLEQVGPLEDFREVAEGVLAKKL